MISRQIGKLQYLKYTYRYLYIISALIQLVGCICLYPCFYPLFDGVTIYTYLFIASSLILALVNFIDILVSSCKSTEYCYGISFFMAIILLAGGVIYSPIVGHQKDREKIYLVAQAAFLLVEIYKFWGFYRSHGKIEILHLCRNKFLLTAILGGLTWVVQLLGTIMFIYGTYIQELVIIGTFFYSTSSIFWILRVWVYISNPNLQQRPCIRKNEEPENSSLSESQQN